jgi:hypothetical protein
MFDVVPDPSDQGVAACLGVGEAPCLSVRQAASVEMVFGDIDADDNIMQLFRLLCLSSGPKAHVSVQDVGKDGATDL